MSDDRIRNVLLGFWIFLCYLYWLITYVLSSFVGAIRSGYRLALTWSKEDTSENTKQYWLTTYVSDSFAGAIRSVRFWFFQSYLYLLTTYVLGYLALTWQNENTKQFQVYMYEDDFNNIHEWVMKKENIETGGDLFGLWRDQHTAVVQLVLGPGKNCRRTEISFYQDVDYLAKSGAAVTTQHGLCNIGQWHSHHRINLPRPSSGDETTVWGNMPGLELNRFLVFIATIVGSKSQPEVHINPFLFEIDSATGEQFPVQKGHISRMERSNDSPFRLNGDLMHELNIGAESMPSKTKATKVFDRNNGNGSTAIDM